MVCKKCGTQLVNGGEYCDNCALQEARKKRSKSFWGDVEKNQTAIEEFGYTVKTEVRTSENTVVYIATNDENETVAIKKISLPYNELVSNNAQMGISQELSQRIHNEMDSLSKISSGSGSRFVITYYDYKLVENAINLRYDLYIRMDYLTSLQQLYSDSKLKIRDLLKMGVDICDALDWCHKNGRVHNNLNMNNIFINNDGRYVLGDFASFINKENDVEYCMAPELYYGEQASASTDIYSLGMVMFTLLNNGLPPFTESDSQDELQLAVKRLKNGEKPTFVRSVNHRLSEVVYKAISTRSERYNSVLEIKKAIEFLLVSMPQEWLLQDINKTEDAAVSLSAVRDETTNWYTDEDGSTVEERTTNIQEDNSAIKLELTEKPKVAEVAPEELALKKKNIKDFWLIGMIAVVLIASIVAGTLFLYNSGNRKIYSLIESESYAVAFKEISQLYEKDKNVDDLLKEYIDACVADSQFKRIVQAVPLFSEEAFKDKDYFVNLLNEIINSHKPEYAYTIAEIIAEYDNTEDITSNFADSLSAEYIE